MIFDEILVDKRAEESALIPTDDQMIDIQVSECLQVVGDELVARLVVVGSRERRTASRGARLRIDSFQIDRVRQTETVRDLDSVGVAIRLLDHAGQDALR